MRTDHRLPPVDLSLISEQVQASADQWPRSQFAMKRGVPMLARLRFPHCTVCKHTGPTPNSSVSARFSAILTGKQPATGWHAPDVFPSPAGVPFQPTLTWRCHPCHDRDYISVEGDNRHDDTRSGQSFDARTSTHKAGWGACHCSASWGTIQAVFKVCYRRT